MTLYYFHPLQQALSWHTRSQLFDNMENILMQSAPAQLQDIQTVTWNQVRTATSSDADMPSLLATIEEGMLDHRCQLPSQLRDYY